MFDANESVSFTDPRAPVEPIPPPPALGPIPKLSEALAKAQAEIQAPTKTRKVDFINNKGQRVRYSYADLSDLIACIRIPLSKNGLAVVHQLEYSRGGYGLTTCLLHTSGERIMTWYPLPDPMEQQIKAQEFGSALTYARRYSLSALIGIASEEDDDGAEAPPTTPPVQPKIKRDVPVSPEMNQARAQGGTVQAAPPDAQPKVGYLSEAQVKRLFAIAAAKEWTTDQVRLYMGSAWGIHTTKDLNKVQYDLLIKVIESSPFAHAILEFRIP